MSLFVIDVQFNDAVYPTEIEIFETYNPGAVVRILAFNSDEKTTEINIYDRYIAVFFVESNNHLPNCMQKNYTVHSTSTQVNYSTS